MPKKKSLIDLSTDDRGQLQQLSRRGTAPTRTLTRVRILLKAAEGWLDEQIVAALDVGIATVERLRKRFVAAGVPAIHERSRPGKTPQLDPKAQARRIAAACAKALEGRKHWTLPLCGSRRRTPPGGPVLL
jgi:hypothetical protein